MLEIINSIFNNWNDLSEKELETLLKKFGGICRDETSLLRKSALSDSKLAQVLLEIAGKHGNNPRILIEIVSSIHNMRGRYDLEITDEIFQFLVAQTNNKKVNFYVSIFITELSKFANYAHKWDYILSIPSIAPRGKSIDTFYRVVSKNLSSFPESRKSDAIKVFEKALCNSNLHEATVNKYLDIIARLGDASS